MQVSSVPQVNIKMVKSCRTHNCMTFSAFSLPATASIPLLLPLHPPLSYHQEVQFNSHLCSRTSIMQVDCFIPSNSTQLHYLVFTVLASREYHVIERIPVHFQYNSIMCLPLKYIKIIV